MGNGNWFCSTQKHAISRCHLGFDGRAEKKSASIRVNTHRLRAGDKRIDEMTQRVSHISPFSQFLIFTRTLSNCVCLSSLPSMIEDRKKRCDPIYIPRLSHDEHMNLFRHFAVSDGNAPMKININNMFWLRASFISQAPTEKKRNSALRLGGSRQNMEWNIRKMRIFIRIYDFDCSDRSSPWFNWVDVVFMSEKCVQS